MGSTASTDFQHYNVAGMATPSQSLVFRVLRRGRELDETDVKPAANVGSVEITARWWRGRLSS